MGSEVLTSWVAMFIFGMICGWDQGILDDKGRRLMRVLLVKLSLLIDARKLGRSGRRLSETGKLRLKSRSYLQSDLDYFTLLTKSHVKTRGEAVLKYTKLCQTSFCGLSVDLGSCSAISV
jgi:hypothetical protein